MRTCAPICRSGSLRIEEKPTQDRGDRFEIGAGRQAHRRGDDFALLLMAERGTRV
jgi:hypothetical protein